MLPLERTDPSLAARWNTAQQGAIYSYCFGYPVIMTKRLIDVDDNKLEAVRTLLDTGTLKATVDSAFDEVLALAARRRALLAEHGVDLSELADSDDRQSAWG
jgi:Arc/MetJ family transcription regulator